MLISNDMFYCEGIVQNYYMFLDHLVYYHCLLKPYIFDKIPIMDNLYIFFSTMTGNFVIGKANKDESYHSGMVEIHTCLEGQGRNGDPLMTSAIEAMW